MQVENPQREKINSKMNQVGEPVATRETRNLNSNRDARPAAAIKCESKQLGVKTEAWRDLLARRPNRKQPPVAGTLRAQRTTKTGPHYARQISRPMAFADTGITSPLARTRTNGREKTRDPNRTETWRETVKMENGCGRGCPRWEQESVSLGARRRILPAWRSNKNENG
jgi:hypothetical protein